MKNKTLSNLNAGLLIFLCMAVFTLVINVGGLQRNTSLNWISYLIVICGVMLVVIKYGKDMENSVTFGNLFAYGFKTTALTTLFFIAFSVLFYVIFPEYKLQILDIARENAMKNATPDNKDQIEKGMEMFQRFFWVGMIAGILISFAILGAIGSLIGAAVTKKDPNKIISDINQIGR
jgi:hypothetical protein